MLGGVCPVRIMRDVLWTFHRISMEIANNFSVVSTHRLQCSSRTFSFQQGLVAGRAANARGHQASQLGSNNDSCLCVPRIVCVSVCLSVCV